MAKAKSYFWGETKGINADIDRHREHEQELLGRIAELESKPQLTEMDVRTLHAWRHFLCELQGSKAEVVNKLGRKHK